MDNKSNKDNKDAILDALKDLQYKNFEKTPKKILDEELESYNRKFNSKEAMEYFHNMVAAYLIEHNKHFPNYNLEVNYRFKSQKSTADKVLDNMVRVDTSHVGYNNKTNKPEVNIEKIRDAFAMKAILKNRPSTFHSSEPKINELVKEKIMNQEFMTKMQEFQNRLIEDEFSIPATPVYQVTKKEYYTKCLEILDRIISFISRDSIEYSSEKDIPKQQIDKYKSIRTNLLETLEIINDLPDDTLIDKKDYPAQEETDLNSVSFDFTKLFNKFSSMLYTYVDLEILTKQSESICKDSELLKKLDVKYVSSKEKRTSNGYISNFIYLDTPFGIIECQIQSESAHREGSYGDAAHNDMQRKKLRRLKLPSKNDLKEEKEFIEKVKYLSPKYYSAKIDSIDELVVLINGSSLFRSYKKVLGQVKKGSPQEKALSDYFKTLKKNNILNSEKR